MKKNYKVLIVGALDENKEEVLIRNSKVNALLKDLPGFDSTRFIVCKLTEEFDAGSKGKRVIGGSVKEITETFFENSHAPIFRQLAEIVADEDYTRVPGTLPTKPTFQVNGVMEGMYGKRIVPYHYIVQKDENGMLQVMMETRVINGNVIHRPARKNWIHAFVPGNASEDDLEIALENEKTIALRYELEKINALAENAEISNELIQKVAEEEARELEQDIKNEVETTEDEVVETPPTTTPPTATTATKTEETVS